MPTVNAPKISARNGCSLTTVIKTTITAMPAMGCNMSSPNVVMGVSGSGKSTVGAALAQRLRVPFADADDFHPEANVAKMAAGHALNDEDRYPWLEIIGEWLVALLLRRREMGMVARGRVDPRLPSRHRQPNN